MAASQSSQANRGRWVVVSAPLPPPTHTYTQEMCPGTTRHPIPGPAVTAMERTSPVVYEVGPALAAPSRVIGGGTNQYGAAQSRDRLWAISSKPRQRSTYSWDACVGRQLSAELTGEDTPIHAKATGENQAKLHAQSCMAGTCTVLKAATQLYVIQEWGAGRTRHVNSMHGTSRMAKRRG